MASFKIHAYRGPDAGTESCDYRGDNFIGAQQGDHHRTAVEVDPAPDALVEKVLELGPTMNSIFEELKDAEPDVFGKIASVLGLGGEGPVGLRAGIWDD